MGAYSTVTITREEALLRIDEMLYSATNDELSEALFALTQEHVADNYTVIDDPSDRGTAYL